MISSTNLGKYSKKSQKFRPLIWILSIGLLLVLAAYFVTFHLLLTSHHYNTSNRFSDIYVSNAAHNQPTNGGIFVWTMTAPKYHNTRIAAINSTWLHRFKHAVVFTSESLQDEKTPFRTVFHNFDDSYKALFHKTKFGFYYAYKGVSDKFDWYVKSDDDTYLVAENLEKYLKLLDPNQPIYAGFRLKPYLKHGYNSGSVYVLSRAAVKIFVDDLYNDTQKCPFDDVEDRGIGQCLSNAGIYPIETRDSEDRGRFHLFNAFKTFHADTSPENYDFYYQDGHKTGFNEFSQDLISLHHMKPEDMVTAHLFLYRVKIN